MGKVEEQSANRTKAWGLVILAAFFNLIASSGRSDEPTVSDTQVSDTHVSDTQYRTELERLAGICDSLALEEAAAFTRGWLPKTFTDRTTLFIAATSTPSAPGNAGESWNRHFQAARKRFAQLAFKRAQDLAADGDEESAYRWLWRTCREWPEHPEAKRILGPLLRSTSARPRLVRGRITHPDFKWPAGTYSNIETPHFNILTRADAKSSLKIALQMEQYYSLWTQFFFPLWAPPGLVTKKLGGGNTPWPRHKGMDVVLLKNRQDYIQVLGVAEANIGVSVGYYNPSIRKSFFYPAEDLQATLVHELTHQLLLEATGISAKPSAGRQGGLWQLEGIALYMESLREHTGYWTVGGIDAPRIQTARYRGVRDGFWPQWETFSSGTMEEWKSDPKIARYYTHATGLSHLLLDLNGKVGRQAYLRALVSLYQGTLSESTNLLVKIDANEETAKKKYQDSLILVDAQISSIDSQVTDLVLSGSELKPDSWQKLGQLTELEWLDLSFTDCTSNDLQWIQNAKNLKRLSLEGCSVTGDILKRIAKLPLLEELDLSGVPVSSQDLTALQGHRSLQTLWLTQTPIDEIALSTLDTLPSLTRCDIEGSRITAASWATFLQQHPNLRP